jgi:hypothetical protein
MALVRNGYGATTAAGLASRKNQKISTFSPWARGWLPGTMDGRSDVALPGALAWISGPVPSMPDRANTQGG